MMEKYIEISLYLECVNFVLHFYAYFLTFHGVLSHFFIFTFISCVIFGILLRYRIPRPKASIVQNYFGKEWGAYASDNETKVDDDSFAVKVVAHRACGLDSPENTIAALKAAHREGMKVVEFDVRLTADDVPVVFHDRCTSRVSDTLYFVEEVTYDQIKDVDVSVKHPFGKNFPGEKIPTLKEYITFCLQNEIKMIIDVKTTRDKVVDVITDLYKQYPKLYDLSLVSSFNALLIYKIRAKDPNILSSLAWRPYYYSHALYTEQGPKDPRTSNIFTDFFYKCLNVLHQWALWKFGYYLLGLSALLLHKGMISREMINYWNRRGVRVIAWNVNLPTEKQYYEKILEITYLTDTVINS